ncbi:hypothetical protein ERJ75_000617200 [Trypanosoma vivax]|nr:hypothetical protein ERJ75_000617200 [Trypanosoma vivax]
MRSSSSKGVEDAGRDSAVQEGAALLGEAQRALKRAWDIGRQAVNATATYAGTAVRREGSEHTGRRGEFGTDDGRGEKRPEDQGTSRSWDRARPASCWTNGQTRRASRGRRQSKHARLLSRRAARRKRGRQAARGHIRQGRGGSSGGELLGGGGEEKRRGACGGVSEPRRGTAIARRGRAAPDRAVAAKTLSATRAERNS